MGDLHEVSRLARLPETTSLQRIVQAGHKSSRLIVSHNPADPICARWRHLALMPKRLPGDRSASSRQQGRDRDRAIGKESTETGCPHELSAMSWPCLDNRDNHCEPACKCSVDHSPSPGVHSGGCHRPRAELSCPCDWTEAIRFRKSSQMIRRYCPDAQSVVLAPASMLF